MHPDVTKFLENSTALGMGVAMAEMRAAIETHTKALAALSEEIADIRSIPAVLGPMREGLNAIYKIIEEDTHGNKALTDAVREMVAAVNELGKLVREGHSAAVRSAEAADRADSHAKSLAEAVPAALGELVGPIRTAATTAKHTEESLTKVAGLTETTARRLDATTETVGQLVTAHKDLAVLMRRDKTTT